MMETETVMIRKLLAGFMIGAIVGISPALARAEAPSCAGLNETIPNFETADPGASAPETAALMNGEAPWRIGDLAGRPVVLNFWATWCAPCVREMPDLDALRAAFDGDGIAVVAVSEDRAGMAKVDAFYEEANIVNLPKILDDKGTLARALAVRVMPTTFLFAADGRTLGRIEGIAAWHEDDVRDALRTCLLNGAAR